MRKHLKNRLIPMRYLLFIAMLFSLSASAQVYRSTFGIRLDDEQIGASYTHRILDQTTVEGFMDLGKRQVTTAIFGRQHVKIAGRRLNWYGGAGPMYGTLKDHGDFYGCIVNLGAEYKFMLFPVVISFDMQPQIYLGNSHPDWWTFQSVFSLKYVVSKSKKKKEERKKKN